MSVIPPDVQEWIERVNAVPLKEHERLLTERGEDQFWKGYWVGVFLGAAGAVLALCLP